MRKNLKKNDVTFIAGYSTEWSWLYVIIGLGSDIKAASLVAELALN